MSKRKKKRTGRSSESSSEKTKRALDKARLIQAEGVSGSQGNCQARDGQRDGVDGETPTKVGYTFNWSGKDSEGFFVPKLDCLPDLPKPLRELVICTARGEETPSKLKRQLMNCSADEIVQATNEGIRRWHTYNGGKERE